MDERVRELAERQYGTVSRRQLLAVGLTDGQVMRGIQNGRLVPIRRGVYALGHAALGRHARLVSAVLLCGPGAAVSHRSAAFLWGCARWPGLVEVASPRVGRRRGRIAPERLEPPLVHRPRRLDPRDLTVVRGIPVTGVARTLVDLAAVLPRARLSDVLSEATRKRLVEVEAIRRALAESRGRAGVGELRRLLDRWHPAAALTRSELEVRFIRFLREFGFPAPEVNRRIAGLEVDFYWAEQGLVVELDGREYHDTGRGFEQDRERTARLELAGLRVLRLTWSMVNAEPARTAAKLEAYFRLTSR